jgi:hypothetical protein
MRYHNAVLQDLMAILLKKSESADPLGFTISKITEIKKLSKIIQTNAARLEIEIDF